MIILVGSKIDQSTIQASLGKPEYSYFFLLKEFLPALERIGQIINVRHVDEVDALYREHSAKGQRVVFLSFSPPNQTPLGLECPTINVFAWEFDSLPSLEGCEGTTDDWGHDPRNDWRYVFERVSGAIATSLEAAELVRNSCPDGTPVIGLPAPVWARYADVAPEQGWLPGRQQRQLSFSGEVIDSRQLKLDPESIIYRKTSEAVRLSKALLRGWWHEVRLPRSGRDSSRAGEAPASTGVVDLDGVVYVSVLNPNDGRKNWIDMVSAFCWAFREVEDATLVLKMTHHDIELYRGTLLVLLTRLLPFRCRVLVLHGFLEDEQYLQLIRASTYYVNASSGEGLCLPLMEFLCGGKPSVAPTHTAMADYLSPDFSFPVATSLEPWCWPHDPKGMLLTHSHRLNWHSLMQAYRASYAVAGDAERYRGMSCAALERMSRFCSLERVSSELAGFFDRVAGTHGVEREARG
jgi:glycosyltransferase involved in cell wall biosynthesis